jgi:adenylate cyclase
MQRSRTKTIDAPVPRDVEAVPMRAEAIAGSPAPVSPSAEQIRLQVARIVSAPAFSSGPRTKNFLQYIVDQTLTGNARRLKQYTIATEVLGRDSSFNPEADPIVRLEAGKLRRALEMYYFRTGGADTIRISVPKGSYVPRFDLYDPSALAPAPPFHPTSNGQAASVDTSRRQLDAQPVVVLPFNYQPEKEACGLFTASLVDQLIVELARYRDISVISLESELNSPSNSLAAGIAAKARFVLSGRVRQSETHTRVTARLHDVESSSIIWTECFDLESATTCLETQDRVAAYIAGMIADYYGVISHTLSIRAVHNFRNAWNLQDSIHRHRYLARTLTERVYRLARTDLEYSTEHAPDHPTVWAALAHTIFYGNVLGFDRDDDWKTLVYRYAQRSFELDHKCAFGHVVMALHQLYHHQFNDVFETCDRILEHNPHAPSTKLSAGFFRALAGDWDSGCEMLTDALGTLLHPPGWAYRVTFLNYFRRRKYRQALHEINKYHAPDHFTPSLLRAAALSRLGRLDEAKIAASEVLRISPNFQNISDNYFRYLVPFEDILNQLTGALRSTGLLK